jgi:uncharacterized protein (UPF0262 family)
VHGGALGDVRIERERGGQRDGSDAIKGRQVLIKELQAVEYRIIGISF